MSGLPRVMEVLTLNKRPRRWGQGRGRKDSGGGRHFRYPPNYVRDPVLLPNSRF
jgi:hypothetical protein